MSITPEQFMTQTEPDEEGPEPGFTGPAPDPLGSIAESLRQLVAAAEIDRNARAYGWEIGQGQPMSAVLEASPDNPFLAQALDDTQQALADLEAKHAELYALLEEIEALLKPSTSKLANTVREAITRWRAPEVPEPEQPETVPVENAVEMGAPPPAEGADVEEWRSYARSLGYAGPDVDAANRSQIRTMLGIRQPGTPVPASVVHEASA